jgi:hypothetical protein
VHEFDAVTSRCPFVFVQQTTESPGVSAIDAPTTDGYTKSQHARPRIEPAFGWLKTIARIRNCEIARIGEG